MMKKQQFLFSAMVFLFAAGLQAGALTAMGQAQRSNEALVTTPVDTTRSLAGYFTPATKGKRAPDAKGFIQRWLVLEPVKKDIARNSIFTENYLRTNFTKDNFSTDFTVVPKNGETVKVGDQELKWYALDSKLFNFKLYRFSYGINKPVYGVLYWVVTVINCPEEIKDVRMAAGCNSSGMFWLNGKEAMMISGDKDMVVDNSTSTRVTLHKGENIIRGAVINGPGMCDFCLRFIDEKGEPVKNFTVSYEPTR